MPEFVVCALPLSFASAQSAKLRILQTNFAGDSIHIIDPATNKVVGQIMGIEAAHGIVTSRDGMRIYLSEEADNTLDVIDGKTLKITKKIVLSGNPNLIDITPDGKTIYVAIALSYSDVSEFPQNQTDAQRRRRCDRHHNRCRRSKPFPSRAGFTTLTSRRMANTLLSATPGVRSHRQMS